VRARLELTWCTPVKGCSNAPIHTNRPTDLHQLGVALGRSMHEGREDKRRKVGVCARVQ
jgi:hypothetical protein